jgi:hypothetical protein
LELGLLNLGGPVRLIAKKSVGHFLQ